MNVRIHGVSSIRIDLMISDVRGSISRIDPQEKLNAKLTF